MHKKVIAVIIFLPLVFNTFFISAQNSFTPNWFDNDQKSIWWATDPYSEASSWRYTLSADNNGWHYTMHSKLYDAGTAACYGDGFMLNLDSSAWLYVSYSASAESILRLRYYKLDSGGNITGEALKTDILTMNGSGSTYIDLKTNSGLSEEKSVYISGIEFTTASLSPGDTVTFSEFMFNPPYKKYGDFNRDGQRNTSDLSRMKSGILDGAADMLETADFNGDGIVDACDAVLLGTAISGGDFPKPEDKPEPEHTALQTYYIDSRSGSDQNQGTSISSPLKSFSRFSESGITAGTHILIKRGSVFNGQIRLTAEGTESDPVIIDVYGEGAKPVINGGGQLAALYLYNCKNTEVRNLELTNTAENPGRRMGIYINAGGAESAGGNFGGIRLKNLDIHDVNATEGDRWTGGIVFVSNKAKSPVCFSDILVEGCTVNNTSGNGITFTSDYNNRGGVTWGQSDYFPSKNVVFRNNFISSAAGDGIFFNCIDGGTLEYNTVTDCCYANGAFAGIWPHNSSNITMQYNESYANRLVGGDGQGFDVDINCENTLVQYNYSHDNEGGFILLCNDGADGNFHNKTTVRYNVSVNDLGRIFTLSGPIEEIGIYNNTVYTEYGLDSALFGSYKWSSDESGSPKDVHLANNIFWLKSTGSDSVADPSQVIFENNCMGGGYNFSALNPKNKLTSDPMFQAPGNASAGLEGVYGYRLKSTSPMRDKGMLITKAGFTDYSGGWILKDGMPDLGAFEYIPEEKQ